MNYDIIDHSSYLEVRLFGEAKFQGYIDYMEAVLSRTSWTPNIPVLINQIELDSSSLTTPEVTKIVEFCIMKREEIGRVKTALLVDRELEYGLNRMWAAIIEDQWAAEAKLFRSRDDAIKWMTA